jgi:NhaP-type Na+/H+ or K+/H+ antiporter
VESGLNDGIAVPLVLLFTFAAASPGQGIEVGRWLGFALQALTLGPVVGVAVGVLGGRLVDRGIERGWINEPFERLSVLGLAALAFAGAELVGGNGFIAAFVAGLSLGNSTRGVCTRLYDFGEAEGQLLGLLVFVAFGAVLVPAALAHATPAALLYGLASLTVVRMLPVALSLLGSGLRPASVAFLGWFGPRGLASIVFVLLVVEGRHIPGAETLETVVVLTVLASTVLHGITAYPLAQRYGALVGEAGDEPEHAEAMDLPVRVRHAGDLS